MNQSVTLAHPVACETVVEDRLATRRERFRVSISLLLALMTTMLFVCSRSAYGPMTVFGSMMFLAGCLLASVGCLGRIWCSLYIAGYKNRRLVTLGPYSLCRHPLYLFSLIGAIGVGMTSETITLPLLIILFFAVYYPQTLWDEETKLLTLYGDEYRQYCQRTPRFWPRLGSFQDAESYHVRPLHFRRALLDAGWFIWLVAIIHTSVDLHASGKVPSLFQIF